MTLDEHLVSVAEKQHGMVTHAQAVATGVTPQAVKHRLRIGAWEHMAEGVYRIPGAPRTWEQRVLALVLAAGPGAAASHRSAAALSGIPGFPPGIPEVSTPRPRRHRHADARVHRSRVFPPHHLTVVRGIVTTRVPRTLFDLAAVVHPARAERAVENCLSAGTTTVATLRTMLGEMGRRGRKGVALMRRLLDERPDDYVATASELEARFAELVDAAGLAQPVRQLDLGDVDGWIGRVDFAYPEHRLVVELDGRRHHSAKLDRESDELRDQRLTAAGWRVVRFGWDDVTGAADRVLRELGALLR